MMALLKIIDNNAIIFLCSIVCVLYRNIEYRICIKSLTRQGVQTQHIILQPADRKVYTTIQLFNKIHKKNNNKHIIN